MEKVLVTGAAGYIGSVLVNQLLRDDKKVIAFDILNFGGESLLSIYNHPNFTFVKGDVRVKEDYQALLDQVDSVVHLAAIVGDPACSKLPEVATETNWEASKELFDLCKEKKNIKRFVFASTCSNYGKMEGNDFLNEDSPLNPVSLYAKLKVKFEKYLLGSEVREDFAATALRFSTVYGISPRIRFDLTVNEFVRELSFGRELVIFGEQFWRPYCHVEDLARSCILVLKSDPKLVKQEVFGVGDSNENYQKKMLADIMQEVIPNSVVKYVKRDEDPRDYRVEFSKIANTLGFKITKRVPDSVEAIHELLKAGVLIDPWDKKYQNI
ncbi:NAD-dependent epimerase/dehydratase family protein [bacterium]|nr:NAD-dependent epimerase/dehydratase family protein [bacterium]